MMLRITLAVAVIVAIFVGWGAAAGTQEASAQDPVEVVQNFFDTANTAVPAGDGETLGALLTEDVYFAFRNSQESFAVVGRATFAAFISEEADPTFQATVTDISATDSTVTGTVEIVEQAVIDAGATRTVEDFTAIVQGDLIASMIFVSDESDPETAQYVAYQAAQDDEDEELPPGAVEVPLQGDQPGSAVVADFEGVVFVGIQVEPGAEGVYQPAHIHTGTCEEPGPIVYPLASVLNGASFTALTASFGEVVGSDYIINVHLSEQEPTVYVSCGVIEEPPEPTPAPTATTIALPSTGSGAASGAGIPVVLLLTLAGVALAGTAGWAALRLRAAR